MTATVDIIGLLVAVAGAVVIALGVAGIGYLLGAPAGLLGALTTALVSGGVLLIYRWRQRRRSTTDSSSKAPRN